MLGPKTTAVRSEAYLRAVASLPCVRCRIEGFSQAAHPNSGKAKGKKADDTLCFPLCCTRPGVLGCHAEFDQHKLFARLDRASVEADWASRTRSALIAESVSDKTLYALLTKLGIVP